MEEICEVPARHVVDTEFVFVRYVLAAEQLHAHDGENKHDDGQHERQVTQRTCGAEVDDNGSTRECNKIKEEGSRTYDACSRTFVVRFSKKLTALCKMNSPNVRPIIPMSKLRVGHDLASLNTRSCNRKHNTLSTQSCSCITITT